MAFFLITLRELTTSAYFYFKKLELIYQIIELFKVSESSAMQLSNQSDTPEVLYYLFLRIKTGVPL